MRWVLISAALFGTSSIMIGAAARHIGGLSEAASSYDLMQTGLRYHQIHSVVLLVLGLYSLSCRGNKISVIAAVLFIAGIFLFSGSLYLAAMLNMSGLTALTPIGGLCFIVGWLSLAFMKPTKAP